MKNFIYLATIATSVLTLFVPTVGQAQGVFVQPFPSSGYSSTTIYVPSLPQDRVYPNSINSTTIVDPFSPNVYPNSNSFPGSIDTPYYGSSYPNRRYVPFQRPTVIIYPQQNIYPRGGIQSACTTSIIGSPIPSPIALNRYTGTPCR
jgi:hypothetical protein